MADIFCLTDENGGLLPPAVQSTVLAKYSRSALSAREIVKTLSFEESDKFYDKNVVGYGHNSVAQMATVPICFEGVSIVASKFIESWQRGGYSEKSTRYQQFSADSFVTPPGAPETMRRFASKLYEAYDKLLPRTTEMIAKIVGKDPSDRTVKARAFDNVRYLLPAGTGTSVGAVLDLRDVRDMITAMRGSTNPEFRSIGEGMFAAAMDIAPALIRHTDPDSFQLPVKSVGFVAGESTISGPSVRLYDEHLLPDATLQVDAFKRKLLERHDMSWEAFSKHMESRQPWQQVPDVFKSVRLQFEITMDYGAFRDLQRHRRCEQTVEPLKIDYGYVVPDDLAGTDLEDDYRRAMDLVLSYEDEEVIHDPDLSQYVIPLGYLHRSVFDMDLKQVYYMVELRTKPQGHISYRRICYDMYRIAGSRFPELMQWCRIVVPDAIGVHH